MLQGCPRGEKESHACWECCWRKKGYDNMTCKCGHPDYPAVEPPKPHSIELEDREIKLLLEIMDGFYSIRPFFYEKEREFLDLYIKIENLIK